MDPLAIAQVSPIPWEDRHEVNTYIRRLSEELAARGHRVLVAAPSRDEAAVRAGRKAIRAPVMRPSAPTSSSARTVSSSSMPPSGPCR